MPSRTRRIIAGTGLAAGLLVGSIAPAAALPGEPEDAHCEKIERFQEIADARTQRIDDKIARVGTRIKRFEERLDRWEQRAEHPAHADRAARRIERMETKVARLVGRIERINKRYDAIAKHCEPAPDEDTTGGSVESETEESTI